MVILNILKILNILNIPNILKGCFQDSSRIQVVYKLDTRRILEG